MIEKVGFAEMYMIYEVMSRARMREPQKFPSEAARSFARQIAMRAHRRAAREAVGE